MALVRWQRAQNLGKWSLSDPGRGVRMATEALIHLATFALTKLEQEAKFLLGVPGQVAVLQKDLKAMKCFLEEAGKKEEEDGRVRNWVSEIREAVYDAEDIIDMFILTESLSRDYHVKSSLKRLKAWHSIGVDIDNFQVQLHAIPSRRELLGVPNIGERTVSSDRKLQNARQSSPCIEEGHVTVGLEGKEKQLVKQLIKGDRECRVISVVGLGGIGKTTLAKKVYNHKEVVEYFGRLRAWVYVSRDCKPREIYQKILEEVYTPAEEEEREKIKTFDEEQLGNFLRNKLEGKKYLVVLDDVWTCEDWNCLAKVSINEPGSPGRVFPVGKNGSILLVTTRDENVAKLADARVPPLTMHFLSHEESCDLIRRKAFLDSDPWAFPKPLLDLGEEMVKKCDGLPLAIVVLGGLLSRINKSIPEWSKVLANMDAYLAGSDQPVMVILNLSYVTLPSHLKLCFLHLCLFPEDHVISTRKLLSLWVAQGFVQKQGEQRLKDAANEYLNQLISRNLVQVVRMSVNRRVMECRVHDFVRKLAIEKAKEENFISADSPSISTAASSCLCSTKFRWQSIHSGFDRYSSMQHSSSSCLASFHSPKVVLDDGGNPNPGISSVRFICQRFKRLRVLDLEGLQLKKLPKKIGQLIFLRYLGLRNTSLKTLPSSIKGLVGLQTLETNNLKRVPKEICQIKSLRDLCIEGQKERKPIRVDKLKNLQNLSGVSFDQWRLNNPSKLSTCLEKLKLQGRFKIEGVELSNSISQLRNLRSLYLLASDDGSKGIPLLVMNTWDRLSKLDIKGRMPKLPEASQFPPGLTQLTLEGTKLDDDPMPILEQLPQLSTLRLRENSYSGDEMGVSPMGFAKLNVLQISELTQLTRLNIESGAMPWLTELQFYEELHVSKLSELQNLVEVDIMGHIVFSFTIRAEIPFHMLLQNGDWKYTPRTYRNNAKGFHLYREQGQTTPSSSELIERLIVFLEQIQKK